MYAYIENDTIQKVSMVLPHSWGNIAGFNTLDDVALAELGWHLVVITDPPYDPATQVRDSTPVDDWDGVTATRTYSVRDKTAQELTDDQQNNDLQTLTSAGKDLALVLTELVQWTLDNTSMTGGDFSPNVISAYQDLKVIADRVKNI